MRKRKHKQRLLPRSHPYLKAALASLTKALPELEISLASPVFAFTNFGGVFVKLRCQKHLVVMFETGTELQLMLAVKDALESLRVTYQGWQFARIQEPEQTNTLIRYFSSTYDPQKTKAIAQKVSPTTEQRLQTPHLTTNKEHL